MRAVSFALLLLAAAVSAHPHHPTPKLHARSIYHCVRDVLKHHDLVSLMETAGVANYYKNPNLAVTFFAPDRQAFVELSEELGAELAEFVVADNQEVLDHLLRYHTCVEPRAFGTKSWPKLGEVDSCRTRLADPADPESRQLLAIYRDADGDAQVEGLESDAELNQNKMNLRCGKSTVHSIDDVLLWVAAEELVPAEPPQKK